MTIAILTANLGQFDTPVDPVTQDLPPGVDAIKFHRFTDANFPPITGLTPRFQYRIPKLFGWQMFPGYDVYIWLDASMSLQNPNSVKWFLNQLEDTDMALFKHPWRNTIKEEVDHIDQKLQESNKYITSRYKNGLHKEQYQEILKDKTYVDDRLYASTAFIYRNTQQVRNLMKDWLFSSARYFTCDQVALPYVVFKAGLKVNVINQDQYHIPYLTLVSRHQ